MKDIFIASQGYELAATVIEPNQNPVGVLLWLIGKNSSRRNDIESKAFYSQEVGYVVLVFDYSGHGDSPLNFKDTTPAQHLQESIDSFDWLTQHYPDLGVVAVCGGSYGGFLAARLVTERKFDRLVLRAPALYPTGHFSSKWQEYDEAATMAYRRNTKQLVEDYTLRKLTTFTNPALIMEHELDEICPPETIQAYLQALPQAEYYLSPRTPHSLADASRTEVEKYHQYLAHWLRS